MGIFRGEIGASYGYIKKFLQKKWTPKNTFICAYDANMKSTI
jgi:hypothetical protein